MRFGRKVETEDEDGKKRDQEKKSNSGNIVAAEKDGILRDN